MNKVKILSLKINNLRLIKAAELKFAETGITRIEGTTRQGKTSIIDAICALLIGKKCITPDMITHESDKMSIEGIFSGGYNIKRVVTAYGDTLEVKQVNDKGIEMVVKKPQTFVDDLISEIALRPGKFINATPAEKQKLLLNFAGLDFTGIDAEIKAVEDERRAYGQIVKSFGEIKHIPIFQPVDIAELYKQKQVIDKRNDFAKNQHESRLRELKTEIESFNHAQQNQVTERERKTKLIAEYKENINEYNRQIEALKAKITAAENSIMTVDMELIGMENKPLRNYDVEAAKIPVPTMESDVLINQQISQAAERNQQAELYRINQQKSIDKAKNEAEYKRCTEKIEALRIERQSKLAERLNTGTIELKDDGLYIGGINSENWSKQESMENALLICKLLNPNLSAVLIDGLESYSKVDVDRLKKWCETNSIQAIVTVVAEEPSGDEEFTYRIVDGNISENGKA